MCEERTKLEKRKDGVHQCHIFFILGLTFLVTVRIQCNSLERKAIAQKYLQM